MFTQQTAPTIAYGPVAVGVDGAGTPATLGPFSSPAGWVVVSYWLRFGNTTDPFDVTDGTVDVAPASGADRIAPDDDWTGGTGSGRVVVGQAVALVGQSFTIDVSAVTSPTTPTAVVGLVLVSPIQPVTP